MAAENSVGEKIRKLRTERKLTVEELAERSHLNPELVRHIEEGELIPSLTPLMKIARELGVRLGTFLDDVPQCGPVVIKSESRKNVVRFSGKHSANAGGTLDFFSLAADKKDRHMEPFIIDVHEPKEEKAKLSSHEGEEFIYVLAGKVEVNYGKDNYVLAEGDSIYYDSIVPHDLHATGGDAKILAIVYAPF